MRPLHRFKLKDGNLVAWKSDAQTDDGDLLLVNEVLFMFQDELDSIQRALLQLQFMDREKMDEYERKSKYALECKKSMLDEFIRKINQ